MACQRFYVLLVEQYLEVTFLIQETVNHTGINQKKPKNIWKMLFVGVLSIALILSVLLILEYSQIQQKETQLSALQAQHNDLESNMTDLQSSYSDLQSSYSNLQTSHSNLQNSYYTMSADYTSLKQKYDMLFQNPPNLQTAFAKTLEKGQVPTLSQLQNWLTTDQTNTTKYNDPDFVCSDFAAMLLVHARTQEWKMGLVFVYGNDTSTHQGWSHAFNALVTTEGLVYVEPQNDGVWWYTNHAAIQAGGNYQMEQYNPVTIHVNDVQIVVSY